MDSLTIEQFNELSSKVDALADVLASSVGAGTARAIAETNRALLYDEHMQQKVAYALNLCTVSVSQIVDYHDIYILEQEYDAILNNLNIEKFVKDDAFLKVLKQILDTVTFFKIQEGDKKMIEKKYQQKMRDAIWSAIPSPSIILGGGSPITMLIGLAASVGTGYMNYRRNKSAYSLEKEEQEWQLQRSAMEQFNGLRRELFEAAWRLSERYNFRDEFRLTEKQISHYNAILIDPDPLRRYERLDVVTNNFYAFPPYWYYKASAAREISLRYKESNQGIADRYRRFAIDHYAQFSTIYSEDLELMREDLVASVCFLEHITLLDLEHETEEIKLLLSRAVRLAGNDYDVLQQCAFHYLSLKETEPAISILRRLINEEYNVNLNGRMLSRIYNALNERAAYDILSDRITPDNVDPWRDDATIEDNRYREQAIANYPNIEKGKEATYRETEIVLQSDITCEGHLVFDHCVISYDIKNMTGKISLKGEGSIDFKQCVIIGKSNKNERRLDCLILGAGYQKPSIRFENTVLINCQHIAENVTVKMNNCIVRCSNALAEHTPLFFECSDDSRIENTLAESTVETTQKIEPSWVELNCLFGDIANFSACSFVNISSNISLHLSQNDKVSISACSFEDCSNLSYSFGVVNFQDCVFRRCARIARDAGNGTSTLTIGHSQFVDCRNTLIDQYCGSSKIYNCQFYNYSLETDNYAFDYDSNSKDYIQHWITDCIFDSASVGSGYLARCHIEKKKQGLGLRVKNCSFQNCVTKQKNKSLFLTHDEVFGIASQLGIGLHSDLVQTVDIVDCQGLEDVKTGDTVVPNVNVEIKSKTRDEGPIGASLDPNTIGVPGYQE